MSSTRRPHRRFSHISVLLILSFSLLVLPILVRAQATTYRIMPLGNSITDGKWYSTDEGGYRRPLYLSLQAAGVQVDFVGSLVRGIPIDFDRDHEGHAGWRADQLRDNIYAWLTLNPADYILLHIGTNDISQTTEDPAEVAQLLDEIDRFEQDFANPITVLVARIILRNDARNPQTIAFNDAVDSLVAERIVAGDDLLMVDMESALDYPADLADAVHPNDAGYLDMAQVWFDALVPLLDASSAWVSTVRINGSAFSVGDDDDLVCTYTLNGAAQTAATCWQVNGQSSMSLYLPFESEANWFSDYSETGPTIAPGGGVTFAPFEGPDGFGAAMFDGSDTAVLLASGVDLSGAYTKALWVKPSVVTELPLLSGEFDHRLGAGPLDGGVVSAGHNTTTYVTDSSPLTTDEWQFVALTYDPSKDGGTMTLFRDGQSVATATGVPSVSAADSTVYVGSVSGSGCWGALDDCRIYRRALTPDQVLSLYTEGRDVVAASETSQGEQWTASVTPFSPEAAGPTVTSDAVTVAFGSVVNLQLVTSAGGSSSDENLIVEYTLPPGASTAAHTWYVDGLPWQEIYLPMNGGVAAAAQDFSGNAAPAVPSSGLQWFSTGGIAGSGAYLFGNSGHLTLGETFPVSSSYTKVGWVKRTGAGIANGGNLISGDDGHVFWAAAIHSYRLAAGHANPWDAVIDAVPLDLDTWYHVAVTYDAATQEMVLYKDGAEVSRATGVPPNTSDATLYIGAYAGGYQWEGYIDDVLIYPRALDSSQIASLYADGTVRIVHEETTSGEEWYAVVTPFAELATGGQAVSNSITIGSIVLTAPSLIEPQAGSGGVVYDLQPTFAWSASAPVGSGAQYRLVVSTDSTFTFRLEQDSIFDTTFAWPDSMLFGKAYWWRVEGYVDGAPGQSVTSPVATFWTWKLGDMNHSHSTDLTDLTLLVNRLFLSGAPIEPAFVADVTGDCAVTLTDLTRLVNRLFADGVPLVPGCE